MKYIINDSHLFTLLDAVFPDFKMMKQRSNPAYTIKSNGEEIMHYENGQVNLSRDFITMVQKFAPITVDKDVINSIGKWLHNKTGLTPRVIWLGLTRYEIKPQLNESEEEYEDNDDALAKVIGAYLNRNEYEGVNSIWVDYNVLFDSFDINVFLDKQYVIDLKSKWPSHWNSLKYEITDEAKSFFPDFKFECYHHFGSGINESEDKSMKKFNRSHNPNKGKYGESIEKLAISYFNNPNTICDILCVHVPNAKYYDEYILMILMPYSIDESKLQDYIKKFMPGIDVMVLVNTTHNCKD